ncbi:DNA-binding transcriptional MocR family regulator [Hydrogenispora ethanolica]|uniref:DNA-binding transcriptional MocR family regulator n=1 Tax=Hydrogenispora ethanolica TaxID=1082276 RepID=A0A4R1SAA8_HYDET|nr:PLP-dependent aminotransferase family protein [Hydrogenispora ethanolica]TCL76443.1 DNA-binding transcriptional MocR family regulator [Hydrogenispora ethanolica]
MNIEIDRAGSVPVYKQIRNQIRAFILSGALPPGYRLPPERKLADTLGVNRTTVLNAYRDLRADALIESRVGQGTVVASDCAAPGAAVNPAVPLEWRQLLSESAARMQQPLVSNVLKLANRSDLISFAAGFSATGCDPVAELLETQKRILRDYGSTALQYSATEGHLPLRESLCRLMEGRGIPATPEEVMVLAGSQQGIDLAARILLDPGDRVIVEEPTFFGALQIFQAAGARIIGVPSDRDGMRVDRLQPLLERYKPKFIYSVPTFQNPSGSVLSLERRRQLLDLAYQYHVPVIEDDAYAELRYDGRALPSLKALDQHDHVIYLSSFSKVLFPGLRVGWVAAARPLVRQYVLAKQIADLHTNSLAQWIMDDFLRRGVYAGQVRAVRDANRRSRDRMVAALKRHGLKAVEWFPPEGGLYFWCRLPDSLDQAALVAKAQEEGVVFVPGHIFYPAGGGQNSIRLSFASPAPEQIEPGVRRLMGAIQELLGRDSAGMGEPEGEIRPIL